MLVPLKESEDQKIRLWDINKYTKERVGLRFDLGWIGTKYKVLKGTIGVSYPVKFAGEGHILYVHVAVKVCVMS